MSEGARRTSRTLRAAIGCLIASFLLAPIASPASTIRTAEAGLLVGPIEAVGVDYDSPPDGQFDYLMVNASIDVSAGGEFALVVYYTQVLGGRSFLFDPGRYQVQVPVEGALLRQLSVNSRTELGLFLETGCSRGCQRADEATFHIPYATDDFEAPMTAAFPGPARDFPVDADDPPDGIYDFVFVDVPVWVEEPGSYMLTGTYLSAGHQVSNDTILPAGNSTIRLVIPGRHLRNAGVLGPILVSLSLAGATGEHWTMSYDGSEFADLPATLESTVRDQGVDTDTPSDGLFDVIALYVPVNVSHPEDYRVSGYLSTPSTTVAFAESVAFLTAGEGEIELRFPTNVIVDLRINASYRVAYYLNDALGSSLDSASASTGAYAWTDLDPPDLEAAGPVGDTYVDIDAPPDGVYDRYVARLPLEVREAGYYDFQGFIYAGGAQFVAANLSYFTPGTTAVNLTWTLGGFTSRGTVPGGEAYIVSYRRTFSVALSVLFWPRAPPPADNGTSNLSGPELTIEGVPETALSDVDADGLFDALVYSIPVNVIRPGPYGFSAMLLSVTNNYRVAHATTHAVLSLGAGTVSLTFSGYAIRASYLSGPYTVYVRYWPGPTDPWPHEGDQQGGSYFGYTPLLLWHQFDSSRPMLTSAALASPPTPDGLLGTSEWAGVPSVDIAGSDPGAMASRIRLANDDANLYVALDVTGDRTADASDAAAIAFDVLTLGDSDSGSDDEFGIGFSFWVAENTFRLTAISQPYPFFGDSWAVREAPFDDATPERADLDAAMAFAPSPDAPQPHRTYEFRVPLTLIHAGPGATIGFAVYSTYTNGIRDGSGKRHAWPASPPGFERLSLNEFARITLAGGPNQAPTVAWAAPGAAPFLSGAVQISGVASDPDGAVQRVDVRVDGGPWVSANGTTSWRFDLDTTEYADGPHWLEARSYDGAAYSAPVPIGVTCDNTPPQAAILVPADGANLAGGRIEISWSTTDAVSGIDRVSLQLDGGTAIEVSGESTHVFTGVPEGIHTLSLTATDRAGNQRFASITVRMVLTGQAGLGTAGFVAIAALTALGTAAVGIALFVLLRRKR